MQNYIHTVFTKLRSQRSNVGSEDNGERAPLFIRASPTNPSEHHILSHDENPNDSRESSPRANINGRIPLFSPENGSPYSITRTPRSPRAGVTFESISNRSDTTSCIQKLIQDLVTTDKNFILPIAFVLINIFKDSAQAYEALSSNESENPKNILLIPAVAIIVSSIITTLIIGTANCAIGSYAAKTMPDEESNLSNFKQIITSIMSAAIGVSLSSFLEEYLSYRADKNLSNNAIKVAAFAGAAGGCGILELLIMDIFNRLFISITKPHIDKDILKSMRANFGSGWRGTLFSCLTDMVAAGVSQVAFMELLDTLKKDKPATGAAIIASINAVINTVMFAIIHYLHTLPCISHTPITNNNAVANQPPEQL